MKEGHTSAVKNLKEIIEWLCVIERAAADVYEKAARHFSEDQEFSAFIYGLNRDEMNHLEMIKAAKGLSTDLDAASLLYLDMKTKEKIGGSFDACEKKLDGNSLTKDEMMDCIVAAEYSEWNDIFLYVTNILKHRHREFIPAIARIEQHKKSIERFLQKRLEFERHLKTVQALSPVWRERILVVDDEELIRDVLCAILADEGSVDWAPSGEEGLKKLSERYYAVIISDVDMTPMNGMEFYKKAVERFPGIEGRFIFFTATTAPGTFGFFTKNGVKYIPKPSRIEVIKDAVVGVLTRQDLS